MHVEAGLRPWCLQNSGLCEFMATYNSLILQRRYNSPRDFLCRPTRKCVSPSVTILKSMQNDDTSDIETSFGLGASHWVCPKDLVDSRKDWGGILSLHKKHFEPKLVQLVQKEKSQIWPKMGPLLFTSRSGKDNRKTMIKKHLLITNLMIYTFYFMYISYNFVKAFCKALVTRKETHKSVMPLFLASSYSQVS